MPTNQTANYALSQWAKSDQVKMEDFNADNAKIDAALKAESDARAALETTKGNCRIWTTSYVGNGLSGEAYPNRIEFPWTPDVVLVTGSNGFLFHMFYGVQSGVVLTSVASFSRLIWAERSVQWYSHNAGTQMNDSGAQFFVVAFGAM